MSYYSRLSKSFEGALRLPLTERSKYVFISDCHRGVGNSNDNFLKTRIYTMPHCSIIIDWGIPISNWAMGMNCGKTAV